MHNLRLVPPPFRQNMWLKTNKSTKNKVKSVYHTLLQTDISSPNTTTDQPNIPFLHKSDVLWKISLIFESLILLPLEKNTGNTTAVQISRRLHLFRTGHIKTLYDEPRSIFSRTSLEKPKRNTSESNTTRNKYA